MSECMSQEDAIKMNNEQAVLILRPLRQMMCDQHGCPISDAYFALEKAIKALEQPEPCSDAISRQAFIDRIEKTYGSLAYQEDGFDRQDAINIARIMPPVQQKRKTGKWINDVAYYDEDGCPCICTRCDQCGEAYPISNYCPNCGAKMEVEQDDTKTISN